MSIEKPAPPAPAPPQPSPPSRPDPTRPVKISTPGPKPTTGTGQKRAQALKVLGTFYPGEPHQRRTGA